MSKKLYVGNLPYETTEEQVRELFTEYGSLQSVAMITDRDTGRFRGFCFVEMEPAAADAAMAALDGQEVGGRNIRVSEARPRQNKSGGRRGGGRRGGRSDFPDSGGGWRSGGRRGGRDDFPDSGGGWRSGGRDDFPDSGGGRR